MLYGFIALLAFSHGSAARQEAAKPVPEFHDVLQVRYPAVEDQHERDFDPYFLALLQLALKSSGIDFELLPVKVPLLVESRSEHNLKSRLYDIHWLNTTKQHEQNLQAIRIPLFKGLIGWRLFFIRAQRQQDFAEIRSLSQLRNFKAGQGHDWPDNDILGNNGLQLVTTSNWESLFKMLLTDRIDYFPRSIIEIWREKRLYPDTNLQIENHLALHYPSAYYFFTHPDATELAKIIEKGLLKSIENGEFNAIFNQYFSPIVGRAELHKRTTIELQRSDLSFPSNPVLWFNAN